MDATLKLWAVIVIVGTLNYLSRLSFIAIFSRRHIPVLLARAFRYVPAAMLTALVLPMVVQAPGGAAAGASAPRIVAALVAGW
ncbi:MAG: AzlD domain-containing protein, partial [Betaproteobacteria bacterium]|nr:AzlD domain-containing protein [Betaproteobacteria bacterium]